ncbi:MAG TPA: hypothetical protein VNN07_02435 [Candidatus Tectomicrobia bacterium]|nr:hypothetical protein [Candidatus Tectomicrobia bacterium]
MNTVRLVMAVVVVLAASMSPSLAADMKDKVKVEVESVGLHPGMDPGMYVCAAGHLHIKGTVHNTSPVTLGRVRVSERLPSSPGRRSRTSRTVIDPSMEA